MVMSNLRFAALHNLCTRFRVHALEDFFNCSRIDLVVLEDADRFVAAEVIKGERLYAQDDYEADEYDLFVLRRAGDLIPLERERLDLILRGGA